MPIDRTFTASPAVRQKVPFLCGLVSPSGGGKTKSALRLAAGMARIDGKPVAVIDSEADRALFYAPKKGERANPPETFDFIHVPFSAPFDPLSYLAAVEHCVRQGAGTIIVDSASHMHEGPGGTLEAHAEETQRLAKLWRVSEDKAQMSAWQKPKSELRAFLNAILQLKVNLIFCFRAKEKMKIVSGQQPKALGYMPISGDEMIFEMALNILLYPGSNGVPSWHPDEMGEKAIIKLPAQFRELFKANDKKPLSEDIGEALARWAAGGDAVMGSGAPPPPSKDRPPAAPIAPPNPGAKLATKAQVEEIGAEIERLGWTRDMAAEWLRKNFGVSARAQLTEHQATTAVVDLTEIATP